MAKGKPPEKNGKAPYTAPVLIEHGQLSTVFTDPD
jgi:hypothetical protein